MSHLTKFGQIHPQPADDRESEVTLQEGNVALRQQSCTLKEGNLSPNGEK